MERIARTDGQTSHPTNPRESWERHKVGERIKSCKLPISARLTQNLARTCITKTITTRDNYDNPELLA